MGLVGRLVGVVNSYSKKQFRRLVGRMRAAAKKSARNGRKLQFQYDPLSYALNFDDDNCNSALERQRASQQTKQQPCLETAATWGMYIPCFVITQAVHKKLGAKGKGLWGYVDGSEPQPAAIKVKEAAQWKVNNAKVISWILGSVDTSISIPMRGLHTAKDMWEYFEKVYQQSNFSLKFQVEHDIFIYGQGEKSIHDYYAGFMNLWTEYEFVTMGKITTACCLRALKDINDERKAMQFLMKLHPDYEIVRVNILNRRTLPTMDDVLGELLREETRIATQAPLQRKTELDLVFIAKQNMGKWSAS
ncbi:hypothetical protein RJ639_038576 [Escallonia herrerae]|uniref:Retrotransposon gag domain-containing protein n=1 Tax=Escallonia herrerae TaxID=1293975 RepID=A0AA88WP43_9ASTE|nr:hypothetical protein RJ639_038576 [Escallonia herrerae]